MNGEPRIIALDGAQRESGHGAGEAGQARTIDMSGDAGDTEEGVDAPAIGLDDVEPLPEVLARSPLRWIIPGLATVAITGWTALVVVAQGPALLHHPDPQAIAGAIAQWSLPVALVLVGVLIARTGLSRASRYAEVVRALAAESRQLDARLAAMNTELSLARDFIAAQARDLESLGRIAVDRLSGSAERLKDLIGDQGRAMDEIGTVSAKALENIATLRTHLPVISNSAKDVANAIAHAGHNADTQLESLITGFNRLNEFGTASARKVDEVRGAVDAALEAFAAATERIGLAGEVRLRAVIDALDSQRARLDQEEIAALAAIRARADALAHELAGQRQVMADAEEASLAALAHRIAAFEADVRALVASLGHAIEDIGRDHDSLVAGSRQRLQHFEESAGAVTQALVNQADQVDAAMAARRAALEAALKAVADGFAERLDQLDLAIGQRRAAMAAAAADSADALETRLTEIDGAIAAQRQRQVDNIGKLAATCDVLSERVAALATTIDTSADDASRTAAIVDGALATLTARLNAARGALSGTDATVADLTDAAVRLLELIEATGTNAATRIPESLRTATAGLEAAGHQVEALRATLDQAGVAGMALAGSIGTTDDRLTAMLGQVATINAAVLARAEEQETRLATLREALRAAQGESDTLAGSIERRLAGAIAELEAAAHKAGAELGQVTAAEISAMAARFGEETSAALARVVQGRGAQMIARLEEAMDSASSSARETALQMRDQLARIDELAGNLESRVARARERAEEQVDSDFARRTALITESLNSTAIDLTRILSAEVSESAWASYLRGERGIFTRRAVSLLDAGEVRTVQQHYETDEEFRVHVNRYIHDFEGMLRQLLSTRDGNALGVTLLSSDMGKLYVALAQGIERLRT